MEYRIHGDNIVECERAFRFIVYALRDLSKAISGPKNSITCPSFEIELLSGDKLNFTFFPGFGERRWNQDILSFVQSRGGRLREATDVIITVFNNGTEQPILAIEFCGALPAGNQAWQRHGRAFSFAHSKIPFFYIAELGGYELTVDRKRKAKRLPNPVVPFSFFSMTHYGGSVCLPVYVPNPGASEDTISSYNPVFGIADFLDYIKNTITNNKTKTAENNLVEKCFALVELLASSRKTSDGLTREQWKEARKAIEEGKLITEYLYSKAKIKWRKTAYISNLTDSAKLFMQLGSKYCLGLTSSKLPISFVSRYHRNDFAKQTRAIYSDIDNNSIDWLSNNDKDLAIAWVLGFKPRHDDARPDRGLPPLARMLIGDNTDLLTFVYGPAPPAHWEKLANSPGKLAAENGLWEAVLAVSDALLCDSNTMPNNSPRFLLRSSWDTSSQRTTPSLCVNPVVLSPSEQDVDTAIHVIFAHLNYHIVFEGMCNPPGGDWSGISFMWSKNGIIYRWLTLPRVTNNEAKRPDHVFGLFGLSERTICICVESKERPSSFEENIGKRLINYTKNLFTSSPSIWRKNIYESWNIYKDKWNFIPTEFITMGAYIADGNLPFDNVPHNTDLDILCGFVFSHEFPNCVAYVKGLNDNGDKVLEYIIKATGNNSLVDFKKASN